jgi:hypothetical protein
MGAAGAAGLRVRIHHSRAEKPKPAPTAKAAIVPTRTAQTLTSTMRATLAKQSSWRLGQTAS